MKIFNKLLLLFLAINLSTQQGVAVQLFSNDGAPHPALTQLLQIFSIDAKKPEEIVQETQKAWLRPADKERNDLIDTPELVALKSILMSLFKKLGLLQQIDPNQKEYDYILIMGAYHKRVALRHAQAIRLCEKGYKTKELVLLGSERPLHPIEEPAEIYGPHNPPKTEYEMMKWIDSHAQMSSEARRIKRTFINTPNTVDANGKIKRATTADTFREWLKTNPTPGSCLIVSNQPFVGYQEAVARLYLPELFKIDATGQTTNHDQKGIISIILDSLARWIYQENLIREKSMQHKG
jgi:hypothetical protein